MTAPAIHLHGAVHTREKCLFDALDLHFPAGQWSVVLGASGVGKTTLLRLIADLPCAGRIAGAITASDGKAIAPRVAMMSQDDLLLPWASALQNVTIGARLRNDRVDQTRAMRLLDAVGLAGLERRKPAHLSAGQRQRVTLARTLYEDRPIVLLDEPFSALDALTRDEMQTLAVRLLAQRTVIMITHDPAEAVRLADAAWIMTPSGARAVLMPNSTPPRAIDDHETLASQADLLRQLRLPVAA